MKTFWKSFVKGFFKVTDCIRFPVTLMLLCVCFRYANSWLDISLAIIIYVVLCINNYLLEKLREHAREFVEYLEGVIDEKNNV